MNKRKWYLKKRMGLMIFIALFFLGGRMEFAKFRYDPAQLAQTILQHGQLQPVFGTKNKDGKTIQFLKIGNRPDLPLVVFVHGSPGALNAYESYLSDTILSQKADLLAIDRMGFGYSDFGETESSLITQSAMIAMVLEDFPQQKKILVGHSMGGPVIARLAVDYPDLVDGLVMVAPSISPQLEPSNTWRRVMDFCLICWMTPPALRVCNQEIIPLQGELEQLVRDWKCLEIPVTVVQGSEDDLVPAENADFIKEELCIHSAVKINKIERANHFILWSKVPLITQEIVEMMEGEGDKHTNQEHTRKTEF